MRTETVQSYQERIARVVLHIERNLDEPLTLEQLAEVASFSPFHFHRVFRGMVGEPVKEHVRRLRLERAAVRLRTTKQRILEIALDAGYETHETFARAFEAVFAVPPSVYRKRAVGAPRREPAALARSCRIRASVRRLTAARVATVRHVGRFDEVGEAWTKLMAWAGSRGLLARPVRTVGIVLDDVEITAPDKLRYDAGMVLTTEVSPSHGVEIQDLLAGDYAVALHCGPYSDSASTYAALCGGWLPSSGRELRDAPALEFYLNSPLEVPPEKLRTELWLPLED
jgi:AraC family transcriptional regulator